MVGKRIRLAAWAFFGFLLGTGLLFARGIVRNGERSQPTRLPALVRLRDPGQRGVAFAGADGELKPLRENIKVR